MKCQVLSRRIVSIASMIAVLSFLCGEQRTASAVDIIWDGGDGAWNDDPLINGVP